MEGLGLGRKDQMVQSDKKKYFETQRKGNKARSEIGGIR